MSLRCRMFGHRPDETLVLNSTTNYRCPRCLETHRVVDNETGMVYPSVALWRYAKDRARLLEIGQILKDIGGLCGHFSGMAGVACQLPAGHDGDHLSSPRGLGWAWPRKETA